VDYFRQIVARRTPSFGHYATALLIQQNILASKCITTNFDKLIERAFSDIGAIECQPIRTAEELQFFRDYPDKAFCFKIHGDYDTHNLLNTEAETAIMDEKVAEFLKGHVLKDRGALVLGTAACEKSIHTLLDKLTTNEAVKDTVLHYGLLWGMYIEGDPADPQKTLRAQIEDESLSRAGNVSKEIVKIMDRHYKADSQFAFFPVVGGAGEFMRRVIQHSRVNQYSGSELLIRSAEPYYDHEMRIKAIFRKHNLSVEAAIEHIARLRVARERIENAPPTAGADWAFDQQSANSWFTMSLCYGSLDDTKLLSRGRGQRAGILSPDDTFISIGGGVALAIARAAGYRKMVHDVSKLAPIKHGDVAVTTAGDLPVEYVLHGASIKISKDGLDWSKETIQQTMRNALYRCLALDIDSLFVPLLAAGTGRATPSESISQIFKAISQFDGFNHSNWTNLGGMRIIVVVFRESELPREEYRRLFDKCFSKAVQTGEG
jgi:O-acetyl-ADP-ribose deacetylase (regulator of RNase III)